MTKFWLFHFVSQVVRISASSLCLLFKKSIVILDVTSSLSAPIPKIDRFYELCLLLCDIDRYVADNLGRVYRGNDVFALLVKRSESPTEIKSTYQKVLNEEGIKLKTGNPNG